MSAKRSRARAVHGIMLLDKPHGVRSNAALQRVKWLFHARKAGHTGSLDAPATGMLPICLGDATKLSHYLLQADKSYWAQFTLGVVTDTGDATGNVLDRHPTDGVEAEHIEPVLAQFRGAIEQVPPMYSALKHNGQRLYELAYQGKEVDRPPAVGVHS